jgi:hypothetical protein
MHTVRCEIDGLEDQLHAGEQIERQLAESAEDAFKKERQQVLFL